VSIITENWLFISLVIVFVGGIIIYQLGKRNIKKSKEANTLLDQYRMTTPILVLEKRLERPTLQNIPKNYYEKLPRSSKIRKMPILKAKVGPQIVTLFCDKTVYNALPLRKTVKVELSGALVLNIVGMNLEKKKKKSFMEKIAIASAKARGRL